jgi:hypothetical protein
MIPPIQPTGGQAPPSVENLDRSSLPGGDPNVARPVTPQPGTPAAEAAHHGALGEIFQVLAGGKKKEWQQTDKGPVATYRDLRPGEMARGILAAAITGLAAGYDPANRGKGPAMSSAFGAGFKGEEERTEKQAAGAEKEAQEQFKNEQISAEAALRLHADARDQMRSIREATEAYQNSRMREVQIAIGQHNLDKDTRVEQEKRTQEWQEHLNGDIQVINPATGKPVDFVDETAASDFAHNNPGLAIRPGKFDTQLVQDPTTGHWTIFRKPWDMDRKQYLGVVTDENGVPKKDAAGNMIIDTKRPYLGDDGKPILPAGPMSERDFRAQNEKTIEMRARVESEKMTALERQERAQELRERRQASDSHKLAMDHYNAAGGDLNALDSHGQIIVTPSDALEIRTTLLKNHDDSKATWQTAQNELQNMGSQDPRRAEVQAISDLARQTMIQNESMITSLLAPRDAVNLLTEKQRKAHGDAAGKIDLDAAEKDMADIPKPLRDKVLDNLKKTATSAAATSTLPADLEKAAGAIAHLPKDQQLQAIQSATSLDDNQKKTLTNYFNSSAASGKVRMVGPNGDIKDVDQKEVSAMRAGGYRLVGEQPNPNSGLVYDLTSPQQVQVPGTTPGTR